MRRLAGLLALVLLQPAVVRAQTFEVLGTRAAGMGGASVGVADDATAVYWNPAGLALGGSYFSLVLDTNRSEAEPDDNRTGGRQSGDIIALSTLPVGVSYYRLGTSRLRRSSTIGLSELERLTTHHAGLTVVQSLGQYVAIGSTFKWVRGDAASGAVPSGDRDDLLDGAGELPDRSTNKFDLDVGVMALFRTIRAGLTMRNLAEPDFSTVSGGVVTLKRQTRAGMSYTGIPDVLIAADVDLERAQGSLGDVRDVAAGAEARILKRAWVRSGLRFNTLSDERGGHAPVYTLGGSVMTFRSLLVDAQVTLGDRDGERGWGIAARLVY
jgi:hypothetical protein